MARNCAITIGINEYSYLRPLNYAVRDADSMNRFFSAEMDFHRLYHFTDRSLPIVQDYGPVQDSKPTGSTLRRFLRTRFDAPFLQDGDNLWFFFAGHGVRHEGRDYLMPVDADPDDLEQSAIPIQYISQRLRRSGADNIILLVDACRSDEGRRDGIGIGKERQQGVITLFSCSPEESSYEIQELEQGAFTYMLLDSLRIQGEGNCATVERLHQRLRHHVPRITQRYRRAVQTPYGVIEPLSKNHLILLPHQATLDDVGVLKKDALTAEVQRRPEAARQLWIRVLAVSPADSEAIEGIERILEVSSRSTQVSESLPVSRGVGRASSSRHISIERVSDALSTHRNHIENKLVNGRERISALMIGTLRVVRHPVSVGLFVLLLTVPTLQMVVNLLPQESQESELEAYSSEPLSEQPDSVVSETTLSISSDTSKTERISRYVKKAFEAEVEGTQVISRVRENAVQEVMHKGADIAAISRPLTEGEKAMGLTEVAIIEGTFNYVYMDEASPEISAFIEFVDPVAKTAAGGEPARPAISKSEGFEEIMRLQEEEHRRRLEEQRELEESTEGAEPVEGTGTALQRAKDGIF